jgi:transcriptional regulator with XRE-family HTH domain
LLAESGWTRAHDHKSRHRIRSGHRARIREARLAQKMSLKDVAALIGVSFQQLQRYESGTDRVPPVRIERLVPPLNRPLRFFFPQVSDVRSHADPMIIKFITSK